MTVGVLTRSRAISLRGHTARDAELFRRSALLAATVIAVTLILWLGRTHTFVGDESDFLGRSLTLADVLRPHNEHLSAIPVVIYRVLDQSVGTGSYLPFLAVLMTMHAAAAAGLYALVGGWRGIGAALVLLFLGSGYENLFWAFQIGFVGSIATGLWALHLTGRRSASLLGLSLACSGVGLMFILPLALMRSSRWHLIPLTVFVLWQLTWGAGSAKFGAGIGQTADWATLGIGWAFASMFAMPLVIGLGLAAAAGILTIWHGDRLARAALVGLLVEYALIAVARASEPSSFSAAPRYVYVAAGFILLMVGRSRLDARLIWGVLTVAFVVNLLAIGPGSAAFA